MKLCTGSEIQKPSVSAFSVPQADAATGTAQPQSLSAAALCFTQIFSCGPLMRAYRLYHTEHLLVNLFRYIVTGKTAAVSDSRLCKSYHSSIWDFQILQKNLNICCSSLRSVCQQSVIRQQRCVQDGFDTHSHTGAGCNYLSGICTVATVIIALCFCDVAHLVDQRHKVRMSCNIACASTMRSRRRPFSMRCAAATAI